MKFLIDENIDRRIALRLLADGHEVRQVALIAPSISDQIVLQMGAEQREIVVTDDKDFGELVFKHNQDNGGVILLRLEGLSGETRAEIVSKAVAEHSATLVNHFTVITLSAVRIRQ